MTAELLSVSLHWWPASIPELVHEGNLALDVGVRHLRVVSHGFQNVPNAHLKDLLTREQVPLLTNTSEVEVVQGASRRKVDKCVTDLE